MPDKQSNYNQGYYDFYIKRLPIKYQNTNLYADKIQSLINKSFFLTGIPGSGKTTQMAEVIREYIRQDKKIEWINYPEFIMGLQKFFWQKDQKQECKNPYEYAEQIAKVNILAIDDLGVEKPTEFVKQITYFIINHREQNQLITLITSNLSLQKIDSQIDDRISSRICGMCECFETVKKDWRKK